jgi:ABC-type multidrug transport system ATPase subunit
MIGATAQTPVTVLTGYLGAGKTTLLNRILTLQLPFLQGSESMGNHDSQIVDAGSVNRRDACAVGGVTS